jgi:hypothetical protein
MSEINKKQKMCFQCQFFEEILQQIGEIPTYISHTLFLLGYDARGTFKQFADDKGVAIHERVNELIKKIEDKIVEIYNSREYEHDDFLKKIIESVGRYRMRVNENFAILPGHKVLIASVVEQSVKEVKDFPQTSAKRVKSKDKQEKKLFQKYAAKGEDILKVIRHNGKRIREFRVVKQDEDFHFECPFCVMSIKVSCNSKTCFNNFERHVNNNHVKKSKTSTNVIIEPIDVDNAPDDAVVVNFDDSDDSFAGKGIDESQEIESLAEKQIAIVLSSTTPTESSDSPSAKVTVKPVFDSNMTLRSVSENFLSFNFKLTNCFVKQKKQRNIARSRVMPKPIADRKIKQENE